MTSTETIRLTRVGEKGSKGDIMYLSLHCRHMYDSCIKMGSIESHFNVSLNVRNKVTRQCQRTTTFEEKGEPKGTRTEVPLSVAESIDVFYWLSLPDVSAGKKPTLH